MLAKLVVLLLTFSLITAIFNGNMETVCVHLLSSPQKAVELTVSVGCGICFWSGVMEVIRQSGLLKPLSRLFSPLISLLFPGLSPKSEAAQNICFNLAANLLGLGAAAAPAGIQAVCQLQQNTLDPTCACDHSILLILLNTASLQLIPTTAAMLRLQAGSASRGGSAAVWLSSVLSVLTGIAAAKGMASLCALPQRQKKEENGMSFFSNLVVPALLCLVFLVAVLRRVDLLSAFAKGVEDGLRVVWEMFPSLLLLTLTVGALSSSGAVQLLCRALQAPAKVLGIPEEVLPLALLRPLSGSGALVAFQQILSQYGPDSFVGRVASVLMGSTETTFYTIALYCSAANIKNSRYAAPASLCADLMGFAASAAAVRLLLG